MRNAHYYRPSDVEKRRWLDRFEKDIRLTYAAADDATKVWLEHYTKRTPHLNETNAKEWTEKCAGGQIVSSSFSFSTLTLNHSY